jgi:hypothetical protein
MFIAVCLSLLPATILVDEVLFRMFGDRYAYATVIVSLGYHAMNLQSLLAAIGFLVGLATYFATIFPANVRKVG